MISHADQAPLLLRLAAPLAWRDDEKIATKLMGFAATEQGSALDMIRAAELTDDPTLRRLFFRHGMDEARHAQRFRDVARQLLAGREAGPRTWEAHHAVRQDLFQRWGTVRFVAFVWLSESRAREQFRVLAARFRTRRPQLALLFDEIGRDEKVHAAYSGHLLDTWRAEGREAEVKAALRRVRVDGAWAAWRNSGRRIGELMVRGLLTLLWVALLPWFAVMQRISERRAPKLATWHGPAAGTSSDPAVGLRRQF